MEHCRHGDLQHYLKTKKSIPAAEAQQLAHQMLEGLDQMHQNGFVHRDLKPGVCKLPLSSGHILMFSEHSHQINATRREVVGSTC
jgi:serine/threonine protein kinase